MAGRVSPDVRKNRAPRLPQQVPPRPRRRPHPRNRKREGCPVQGELLRLPRGKAQGIAQTEGGFRRPAEGNPPARGDDQEVRPVGEDDGGRAARQAGAEPAEDARPHGEDRAAEPRGGKNPAPPRGSGAGGKNRPRAAGVFEGIWRKGAVRFGRPAPVIGRTGRAARPERLREIDDLSATSSNVDPGKIPSYGSDRGSRSGTIRRSTKP